MNQAHDGLRERISALADGQLHGELFAEVVTTVAADDEMRAVWRTYHLVGDVLRSGAHAPCTEGSAFVGRLQQRLAQESQQRPQPVLIPQAAPGVRLPVEAANEPVFRWKMVAGVASLAAVAAISWSWVGTGVQGPSGAQLAQQSPPSTAPVAVVAAGAPAASTANAPAAPALALTAAPVLVGNAQQPQVMLRDPRLDELLEAHQQAAGATRMPSGFLRAATFEGASR